MGPVRVGRARTADGACQRGLHRGVARPPAQPIAGRQRRANAGRRRAGAVPASRQFGGRTATKSRRRPTAGPPGPGLGPPPPPQVRPPRWRTSRTGRAGQRARHDRVVPPGLPVGDAAAASRPARAASPRRLVIDGPPLFDGALHRPVDLPEPQRVRGAQQQDLPTVVLHPQLVHLVAALVGAVEPAQRDLQERGQGQRAAPRRRRG